MAATNVQAFPGDVTISSNVTVSDAIIADNGTNHSLTIDASSSMIYNKELTFTSISADSYNYVGRFSVYSSPAIFSILDSGSSLGSGSRYSMAKQYGADSKPIMNALEGAQYTNYTFVWQANGSESYDVWFKPDRAGNYIVYVHARDYTFPTAPGSPTYLDVLYGLVNLSDSYGGRAHAIIGAPSAYGNASLQLFNNGQTTNNRLTHEAIQLFSNAAPATGAISNVYITMTPSTTNNGYGGYIEGWVKAGTDSGLTIGSVNQGTKHAGITVIGSTAKVGIGTTNPLNGLDVRSGDGSESDTHATFGKAVYASAGWSGIRLGTPYAAAHDAYCSVIESYNDHNADYNSILRFKTSSGDNAVATERMRIDADGNVGIGTTNPDYKLKVEQGEDNNSNGLFISNSNYGSMQGLNISMVNSGAGGFASYAAIQTYRSGVAAAATNLVLNPTAGNVGIGTNAPTAGFNARTTGNSAGLGVELRSERIDNNGYYSFFKMKNIDFSTTPVFHFKAYEYLESQGNGYPIFLVEGSQGGDLLHIEQNGKVGIGTASPYTRLQVYGNFACQNFHALGSGNTTNFAMRQATANNTNSLTQTVRINAQGRPTVVKVNYQGGSVAGAIQRLYSSEITFNWNGNTTLSVSTLYVHNNGGTWTINLSVISNGTVTLQVVAPGSGSYNSLLTQWYCSGGIYVE